jgi:LacI family transcriptional regulator
MDTILVFRMCRYDSWHSKVQALTLAAERRGWHLQVIDQPATPDAVRKLVTFWHPKGVVVVETPTGWRRSARLALPSTRTVFLDSDPAYVPRGTPNVIHATKPLCEAVVREFLSIGCTSIAYIGWFRKVYWSDDRIHHLKELLDLHGLPFLTFDMNRASAKGPASLHRKLCRWLKSLPCPCGVFAANDTIAEPVFDAARACGLSIPSDLAVIGIDNDFSVCERLSPSLSTFRPEYGPLAERVMDLIEGLPVKLPFDELTARFFRRQSTRRFKHHDADVENAVERIRKEACNGITASEVLADFSCSRRLAEMRFKSTSGKTVLETILDARFERLFELLENRATPVGALADLCGFPSALVMRRQFRARTGTTPTAWREKTRRSALPLA